MTSSDTFSIFTGLVTLLLGLVGAYVSYTTAMEKIHAEIKAKEEEKETQDRLTFTATELSVEDHDASLADRVSKTMKTMLANLQTQIDQKDKQIEYERKQFEKRYKDREEDFSRRISQIETSLNTRISGLEERLAETLRKLKDREAGIDLLTAQVKARNEEPVYRRRSDDDFGGV